MEKCLDQKTEIFISSSLPGTYQPCGHGEVINAVIKNNKNITFQKVIVIVILNVMEVTTATPEKFWLQQMCLS